MNPDFDANPSTMDQSQKVALFSSCVDLGTSSITKILEETFVPCRRCYLERGLKHLSIRDLLRVFKFLILETWKCDVVIAAFNAPVLLTGLLGWFCRGKKVAILEWNELTERSRQKIPFFQFYGALYKVAFAAFDQRFSPSPKFIDFYRRENIAFSTLYFPIPPTSFPGCRTPVSRVRMLFVGGDIKRKGGDLLLSAWSANPPADVDLTFVTPNSPALDIPGVSFINHIRNGTDEHRKLFKTHDVLILPTFSDSFGYVLLEALSSGMAVVTTRHAGAAHVVTLFGGLVLPEPAQAIAAALELVRCPQSVSDLQKKAEDFRLCYAKLVEQSVKAIQSSRD